MKNTSLSICLLVFCLSVSAGAQIRIGTVTGVVTDPARARIAGAKLTLSNTIAGFDETRIADASGEFVFNNLPFATYSLRVEAAGFQTALRQFSVRSCRFNRSPGLTLRSAAA